MRGVYEYRQFLELDRIQDIKEDSRWLTDIYLHKKQCTQIGIKFRKPQQKEYGWKLTHFQCKVAEMENHQGCIMEKWRKHEFKLDQPIKLKIHQSAKRQMVDSSGQESGQHSEYQKKIAKKAKKMHECVSAVLLKSDLSSTKEICQWCSKVEPPVLQIFISKKSKVKESGIEVGKISIQRMIGSPKFFYFKTKCIEDKDWSTLLQSNYKANKNTSYPKLLQQLMNLSAEVSKIVKPSLKQEQAS